MSGRVERRQADYKALLTEAYDLDKPEPPPQELAYYLRHIQACGEPVLEAMCGSGRFLVPLLEAGIDADGVDASPDMLAACAAKCAERSLTARTYQQLLHELDLPRRYRLIFTGGVSFGLIVETAEVVESLKRLHSHLHPGGALLIEIATQHTDERSTSSPSSWQEPERRWTRPDGADIVLEDWNRDRGGHIRAAGLRQTSCARTERLGLPALGPGRLRCPPARSRIRRSEIDEGVQQRTR